MSVPSVSIGSTSVGGIFATIRSNTKKTRALKKRYERKSIKKIVQDELHGQLYSCGNGVTLTAGIWWVARRRCCHGACRWVPTFAAERAELYKIIMQMPSGDDVVLEGCHDRRAVHTSSGGLPADGGAGNALAASFTGGCCTAWFPRNRRGCFSRYPVSVDTSKMQRLADYVVGKSIDGACSPTSTAAQGGFGFVFRNGTEVPGVAQKSDSGNQTAAQRQRVSSRLKKMHGADASE